MPTTKGNPTAAAKAFTLFSSYSYVCHIDRDEGDWTPTDPSVPSLSWIPLHAWVCTEFAYAVSDGGRATPPSAETHAHHTHQPPAQSRGCRTIRIPLLLLMLLLKLLLMLLLLPLLLPPPPPLVLHSGAGRARRCAAGTEHGDHDDVCSASSVVPICDPL